MTALIAMFDMLSFALQLVIHFDFQQFWSGRIYTLSLWLKSILLVIIEFIRSGQNKGSYAWIYT